MVVELSNRDREFADYLARRVIDRQSTLPGVFVDALGEWSWRWYVNLPCPGAGVEFHYHPPGTLELVWKVGNGDIESHLYHRRPSE